MGTTPAQAMPLQATLHLRHKALYPSPAKEISDEFLHSVCIPRHTTVRGPTQKLQLENVFVCSPPVNCSRIKRTSTWNTHTSFLVIPEQPTL